MVRADSGSVAEMWWNLEQPIHPADPAPGAREGAGRRVNQLFVAMLLNWNKKIIEILISCH